ncbi:stage II sporulation protein R [Clostridium acetobutylicum]|uniref:Stage II sporulation protein R n=1 Tax=Clostridium acetobutylicum (strain ATCC 824 / DSM 792 / JCM 1419 / IAM 19013 / LMG 5710 / NBRC 13948 / NRRL B-527 / VKM B-1787 / 2291 / W) TaxID=272562 RepID=Q97F55_CLOAB|nr:MULTISPECIES: stage II sporulation protein R [Clostridium]AAK80840.1 Stage II sporulation protein R [Clostridium acetobutylicum ATCC 824]AEI33727.1 stage II sporulation protein R [Clostridium acetobutylicum DSM 1731]AWV78748.1 stage II sporulation protein R [Clostridium acetobutylicum]MBC2393611.1 stage II sporulation protein R [Clostridium acetobutylicum]MBC2585969.1 stage II sporulation protein R [Clostridium acetobutylicum]
MKKKIFIVIILAIFYITFMSMNYVLAYSDSGLNKDNIQISIAKKVIRFHVLANSDSDADQNLKLKVRDAVINYMRPKLQNCKDINQSRKVLLNSDSSIKRIADSVIKKNGYQYKVNTELAKVDFPVKSYGNIVLPEGKYEAYRILIGQARGHNWWCVMFPPLCFTDITRGAVEEQKTDTEMKKVLTPEEYKVVCNSKDDGKIKVKFKIVEEVKKVINKLEK